MNEHDNSNGQCTKLTSSYRISYEQTSTRCFGMVNDIRATHLFDIVACESTQEIKLKKNKVKYA